MVFFGSGDNFHTSWRPLLLQEKLAVGYLEELRLGQNCGCPHLISPHDSWKAFETIQIEMRLCDLIFARCFSQREDLLVRCHFTPSLVFPTGELPGSGTSVFVPWPSKPREDLSPWGWGFGKQLRGDTVRAQGYLASYSVLFPLWWPTACAVSRPSNTFWMSHKTKFEAKALLS